MHLLTRSRSALIVTRHDQIVNEKTFAKQRENARFAKVFLFVVMVLVADFLLPLTAAYSEKGGGFYGYDKV